MERFLNLGGRVPGLGQVRSEVLRTKQIMF